MLKTWKIKRELRRFKVQTLEIMHLASGNRNRARYDREERPKVVTTLGDAAALPDMAILLIYQPKALLNSLFLTLEHLNEQGVSVLLVANHTLSSADIDRLRPHCHLIVQRPNIGYDFGGYREGMLTLFDRGITPETLFVLNDSVWFPLARTCTLIQQAKAAPEDVFGIFRNTKNKDVKHHHLQSYFYRFKKNVIKDPQFQNFWRTMPFFDTKRLIVRQFEVKLTGRLSSMGFSIGSRLTPPDVEAAGLGLSDDELLEVAAYHRQATLRGRAIFEQMVELTPDDPDWGPTRTKAITDSRFKYYLIDAHPIMLFKYLDVPFLKKSREYHYYSQRDAVIAGGFHTGFDPIIQAEVLGWNASGVAGKPNDDSFPPIPAR
ncbi:rhamnan synthesis F family protein [Tateyamaria sp.]|uniref:rhamnan synthesis F family protein n=1 Tax=Tateyamaria sp. TaxID=1929288 RepID=UPI00329D634B